MNPTTPPPCPCQQAPAWAIKMAFQPIVDTRSQQIYAQEALVRGAEGASALSVLAQVNQDNYHAFDQQCRTRAIQDASTLQLTQRLHINFMPGAIYHPERCLRSTLQASQQFNFPLDRLTFEITEAEKVDSRHLSDIVSRYKTFGFKVALDDFGAGYAGLNLLADIQPDILKLDIGLIRDVDSHRPRQIIIKATITMARELGITLIAEGIETAAEAAWLNDAGIHLHQGFYYARPGFQSLPVPEHLQ